VPQGLIDQVSKGGEVYAVLVGVHRGNVLWYNKRSSKNTISRSVRRSASNNITLRFSQ
jgi:hypothetical protein